MISNRKSTLAQKYRPLIFKDVLGQESIVTVLKNILKNKNYSSPFMFTGLYGGGKTTLARIFARAILCTNLTDDYEPCNKCESCKSFLEESNLSYVEIDAASNSGVDKIRKLREDANFKSLGTSDKRVVVIDESHSITSQGNEALLKQLEESTERQIYVFCTTAPEKMLDTVRSRCFEFGLNKIPKEVISERLQEICKKESIPFENNALNTIAEECSPHVRDAIKELDYLSNFGKVTSTVVSDHFKLGLTTSYLNLIFNIGHDILECLNLAKSIYLQNSVPDIYEGLIHTIISCKKLDLGLNNFKNIEQVNLAKNITELYKNNLDKILEEFLKRNRYVDSLVLESDLILIHGKLRSNFVYSEDPIVIKRIVEVSTLATLASDSPNIEIKKVLNEEVTSISETIVENSIDSVEEIGPLEQTTQILKRYKAFPEQLAILMDKGKKSSSIKNSSTVELKQRVKDFKNNLDREEIKDFLENKRNST